MLKKLQVLAAMYRRRVFTIGELIDDCGVNERTIQTVVQRLPDEWFVKKPMPSGTKGRQPNRIDLTALGVEGIETHLGRLPRATALTPVKLPEVEPMGLTSARRIVERFSNAGAASAQKLRRRALQNLDAAAAEIKDGGFPAQATSISKEIASLRARLAAMKSPQLKIVTDSSRSSQDLRQRMSVYLKNLAVTMHATMQSPSNPVEKVVIAYLGTSSSQARVGANAAYWLLLAELMDPLEGEVAQSAMADKASLCTTDKPDELRNFIAKSCADVLGKRCVDLYMFSNESAPASERRSVEEQAKELDCISQVFWVDPVKLDQTLPTASG